MVHQSDRFGRWARAQPALVDALLAALVLATFEMPAFDPYRHDGGAGWPFWGVAIAGPLLWRRRAPLLALVVCVAGTVGSIATQTGPNWGVLSEVTILLGPALALGTLAVAAGAWRSQLAAVGTGVAVMAATQAAGSGAPDVFVAQAMALAASWLAGEVVRARRHEVVLLRDRIANEAAQAASEERNRIARELHDVVAHQLSVIAIQSGAGRLAAGEGGVVGASLVAIEEAARQALTDLRGALGVLRAGGSAGVAPQPRLAELDGLAGRLRHAGLPLELITAGDLATVPAGVSVSSFRIIQEALTNVVNHAGTVPTIVRVERTLTGVELEVRNGPPARAAPVAPAGGQGLIGMRERVAAYRGEMEAGSLPTGGFAVRACIPLP